MMTAKLLMTAVVLGVTSAPIAAQPPAPPEPGQVVVTSGEGIVRRAPDRAFVTIASESRARTPQEAQRVNADAMSAVIAQLKTAGVAAEAIQTMGYNLQPEFDYANGKQTLRGYVARNQVQVRVDTLATLGGIISASVVSGATSIGGIRFDVKEREALEREALRNAVADARARADAAAAGAGLRVDRVVRIEEQRDMPVPMGVRGGVTPMMAQRAEVPVPLESGEIEIHARVTLTAAIR